MNEPQVIPATGSVTSITPMDLLRTSVDRGDDLARIEKLMELERLWKADRAKEAFNAAMAEFKKVPLIVVKDKENKQYSKDGKKAMYVGLANLVNTVNPVMAPFGLSADWEIDQSAGIRVTCVLTHTLGYSKRVGLTGQADDSGSKNKLQQIKSTITYLRGATFEAVTGVVAQDDGSDDDGNGSEAPPVITADQVIVINDKIAEAETNKAQFLSWMKAETVEQIKASDYDKALTKLASIAARKGKK